jgi:uncharacterized damage-inducible protein DinB
MRNGMRLLPALACFAVLASAQQSANPLVAGQEAVYSTIRNNLIRAAEKMPEENYSFKPTPEVMTFGELVGHVADSQYTYCYSVTGERLAAPGLQKARKTKAELVAGLKEAFSLCDKAISGLTDAKAMEPMPVFGRQQPRLTVLTFNTAHNDEHYGNIVTYMRIKGLVPPSSEGRK